MNRAAALSGSREARELPSRGESRPDDEPQPGDEPDTSPTEPCLHCGHPVAIRRMGCKGGHCPNCRHPYPHGDCSD